MRKEGVSREVAANDTASGGQSPGSSCASQTIAERQRKLAVMMAGLAVLLIIGQLLRNVGATLSPVLVADLGLKPEALAQVISVMFLAIGLSQLPVGVLLDRFGPRWTIACTALVAVVGCVAFAASTSFFGMMVGRALTGAGLSATVMGSYLLILQWVSREKFSTYGGLVLFIGGLGGVLATTPLALLLDVVGWRHTFVGIGIATALGAALTFLLVRDAPRDGLPAQKTPTLGEVTREFLAVVKFRHLWPLFAIGPILYTPQQILLGLWAGPFLEDVYALDAIARSHILLAMSCGTGMGMLFIGSIERLFKSQKAFVFVSMVALSAMFLALALLVDRSIAAVVILLCAISLISPFFVSVAAHAQTLQAGRYSGRVLSLLNMTSILGVFLAQNVTGSIAAGFPSNTGTAASGAYQAIFFLMMTMFLAGALIYRTVRT
jgi:predicted MFS family arabinose efflux permease